MKEIIENQMLAALATLKQCFDNCPDTEWEESHNDAPFSQVMFHTLFFTDYYLSVNEIEFKLQKFHIDNKNLFRDYEELEYKKAEHVYSREEIKKYFDFCFNKVKKYFKDNKSGIFTEDSAFIKMTVCELLIYLIRHIQHHAAQLGLRIQQITGKELIWVSSGWTL
ncbi:MAG: DinB family protein [Treponema sp.]|nr:DinB family protein [Treponema sp.]